MKKFGDKGIGFVWGVVVSLAVFDCFNAANIGFWLWLLILLVATICTICVEAYLFVTDYKEMASMSLKAGQKVYGLVKKYQKEEEVNG